MILFYSIAYLFSNSCLDSSNDTIFDHTTQMWLNIYNLPFVQDKILASRIERHCSKSKAPVNTGRLGAPVTPTSGDDDRCCRLIG